VLELVRENVGDHLKTSALCDADPWQLYLVILRPWHWKSVGFLGQVSDDRFLFHCAIDREVVTQYVVVAPHRVVPHSTTHVSATGMCDCLDFKARDNCYTHTHLEDPSVQCESKKSPPLRFSDLFSQTDGNFLINFCKPIIRSFLH